MLVVAEPFTNCGGQKAGLPEVAVFRHNLFRASEPFITQQAQQLRRFKPFYLGRLRFGEPPDGADSLAMQDLARRWSLPVIGWQMLTRNPRSYQRLLVGHRPALIHAHFGIDGVYALPLARRLGVPLVTTFHGFDATLATGFFLCSPAWANYPLFRRRLARQGNLFLCVSSFIRDRVLAMGFPEHRVHVHYIGIDIQATQPRDPREEMPIILHIARLVETKGTAYLIRAFAKLARQIQDAQLVIIGDGPLKRRLQILTRSPGLSERVRFLGALPHEQVMTWMRQAAMLALPSVRTATGRTEALGMVLLEAGATGVPAIGSCQGGIPEAIIDGETGFLVPERDVEGLAERMRKLLGNRPLRLQMGSQARALVERRFDIRRQTEALEGFYDAILSDRN
jgi:glycosyltransferase involved in cell wall biosynthesis